MFPSKIAAFALMALVVAPAMAGTKEPLDGATASAHFAATATLVADTSCSVSPAGSPTCPAGSEQQLTTGADGEPTFTE